MGVRQRFAIGSSLFDLSNLRSSIRRFKTTKFRKQQSIDLIFLFSARLRIADRSAIGNNKNIPNGLSGVFFVSILQVKTLMSPVSMLSDRTQLSEN